MNIVFIPQLLKSPLVVLRWDIPWPFLVHLIGCFINAGHKLKGIPNKHDHLGKAFKKLESERGTHLLKTIQERKEGTKQG